MKKILLTLATVLLFGATGCAQILGVGNRSTYTPLPTPYTSPAPGVYSSSQSVSFNSLGWLLCYTTDGTVPTASGLYTSGAACTGTSTEYVSGFPFTVSTTTVVSGVNFPNQYGTGYVPSSVYVGTYVISSTGFVDNFPYSTGDLVAVSSGNWAYQTGASSVLTVSPSGIVSPNLSVGGCTGCLTYWTGSGGPAPANQSTQVTFTGMTNTQLGPAVRVNTSGTATGYGVLCGIEPTIGAPGCQLVKDVSGTQTVLVSTGSAISSTSTVKLTVSGSSPAVLTVTVNGATYATYSDSSSPITSGGWGLFSYPGGDSGTHISQAVGTAP